MAIPTARLYDPVKMCTTEYRFEEDQNVDLRLRNCIRAMDRTIPKYEHYFKMMSFFTKLVDSKLPEETITRVMHAVNFLIEHSDEKNKNPLAMLAIDRIVACLGFQLGENDLFASAYYGLNPASPNLEKAKLEAVFTKDVVEKLEGIESVTAEQAAGLDPLAKRVKLLALYCNSDEEVKEDMKHSQLSSYQERIRPIWKACMPCESEGLSNTAKALFEKRDQVLAKGQPHWEYSMYSTEPFLSACLWGTSSGARTGYPGINWKFIQSPNVGCVHEVEGTIFKVGAVVKKQGYFIEIGNMEVSFTVDNSEGRPIDLIIKDIKDETQKPSIEDYKPTFSEVRTFASYLKVRKKELVE